MLTVVERANPSQAVEDYVLALHELGREGDGSVSTSALAARLRVTPGSVSAMVKRLEEKALVVHRRYGGTALTPSGVAAALRVLRRRRLVGTFLAKELGLPLERVGAEADALQHALSDELAELIATKLGNPVRDPFGDPIPTADCKLVERQTVGLTALAAGTCGTFVRLAESDPAMLGFLAALGIAPGDALEVVAREPFGGPLLVRFDAGVHPLGGRLAEAMRVEPRHSETDLHPTGGGRDGADVRPLDNATNGDRR